MVDIQMRRSAEAMDNRGSLRVFDQSFSVEYRRGGSGPGLDAGEVKLDERAFLRDVQKRGIVYRAGRDESDAKAEAGGDAWMTLANSGAGGVARGVATGVAGEVADGVAATSVRVKLAPFPLVTQPLPGQTVVRTDDLSVVMLPPLPDLWQRVSLVGVGDPLEATSLGEGRWLFPREALAKLEAGRARVLVEVETSCGDCEGGGLRATWSTRSELEIPVTVL